MKTKEIYYCPNCGSNDVLLSAWFNPNDGSGQIADMEGPLDFGHCNRCDENVGVLYRENGEGDPLTQEEVAEIDRLSDELCEVATFNTDKARKAGKQAPLVDRLRETFGSYLGCVAEDGRFREETFGGLVNNLRRDLRAYKKD